MASVAFTSLPTTIQAGQSYEIQWTGGATTAPVTLILRQGDPNNLETVETLTTTATGGSYIWNVPSDLPSGSNYALEISQGSDSNFSNFITISGGSGVTTTPPATTAPTPTPTPTPEPSTSAQISASASAAASSAVSGASSVASDAASSAASISASGSFSSSSSFASPSASSSSTSTPSQSSPSLSTGDKAAIGVGVVLGVILIAGIAFWFGKYGSRRKKAQQAAATTNPTQDAKDSTTAGATELATRYNTTELPAQWEPRPPAELSGSQAQGPFWQGNSQRY